MHRTNYLEIQHELREELSVLATPLPFLLRTSIERVIMLTLNTAAVSETVTPIESVQFITNMMSVAYMQVTLVTLSHYIIIPTTGDARYSSY